MFGKKSATPLLNEKENVRINERLDEGEKIIMSVRQSRVKPGGAAVLTPNSIFITHSRIIIRNPVRLGLGEHIEEYFYHQITNVRLEKGLFSSSLVFAIPGLTEISKTDRKLMLWGRDSEGIIDAIPKDIGEAMYNFVRERIEEAKLKKEEGKTPQNTATDPINELKVRFARGEITKEEFEDMKSVLE